MPHPDGRELPILINGKTQAYLQIPRGRDLPRSIVHAFIEQQRQSFTLIAAGMLLASVLAAWLLSHWIGTTITALASGTRALIAGDCDVRLPVTSKDELGQLSHDFNLLAQTLSNNRRSRQEWIVNIAHELRTPLTVMLGEIEAVEDGVHAPDRAWQTRLGQRVRQLSLLVNDLHQLAESDLGALHCHKAPTDLAKVTRDWLESHRLTLERSGLSLEIEAEHPVPAALDLARWRQLLGNLLQNSLRYTDPPGVLHVALETSATGARMIWEDSAPGVGDADLARLTERLYRVETSRSRAKGGAGLGLSIVQAIVDAHGGTLQIDHSPFGGVRLTLALNKE
jgi:two-component system sensor histidine kinase BaeS